MIYNVGKFIRHYREKKPIWIYTLFLDRFHNFESPEKLVEYLQDRKDSVQLVDIANTEDIFPKIRPLDLSEKILIYQLDMSGQC